jgi:excisionase family DNA binding protein
MENSTALNAGEYSWAIETRDGPHMDPSKLGLTQTTYRVKELVYLLRIGRGTIYNAIRDGTLKAHKVGRSTIFLACDVADYLDALPVLPAKPTRGAR